MPTKGKLPTAREMEGQILAALQELGEEKHYKCLDHKVQENLEPLVYIIQFKKETQDFWRTSFSSKCARARRSLRKQGLVNRGTKKGYWQLIKAPQLEPSKVRKPGTSRVSNFAAEAIERLEMKQVSPDAINSIRELWLEFQMAAPESRPGNQENREVEDAAIKFVLCKGKGWHDANKENHDNPGFDLYQTQSGKPGLNTEKITLRCEVKSLSGDFSSVSLTHTEFNEARRRGKKYWLYIVENVGSGQPNLIRINDPGGKAQTFTYKHRSWRNAAEK